MSSKSRDAGEEPLRIHFIPEWCQARGMKQSDLVRETGADKGVVSRWFSGVLPHDRWLPVIAAVFDTDFHGLFKHPDEQKILDLFEGLRPGEIEKARQMLAIMLAKPD